MRTTAESAPDLPRRRHAVLHLEPGFVATEAAAVQDVLRIANRHLGRLAFRLTVTTSSGQELVESLSGSLVRAEPADWHQMRSDFVIVGGGSGIRQVFKALLPAIARSRRAGAQCLFLSDAAAEWACCSGRKDPVTTHWENRDMLEETRPGLALEAGLFSRSGGTVTSAGMVSAADLILSLVVAPVSAELAGAVARSLVMEGIRSGDTAQRPLEAEGLAPGRTRLAQIIRRMEENIETPLRLKDLAAEAGLSVRQVERNFKTVTGRTPAGYYRWLRLRRGKNLLEQTGLSVLEVAVSCGFSSNCGFSRVFRREFGVLPSELRRQAKSAGGRWV
jgi:AraC family carnitine catabolism transcriptional activator